MKPLARPFAIIATLGCPTIVAADPSVGIGFSYIFGGDVAVGLRVFSTNNPKEAALALGIDYKFDASSLRPNVGVAYLEQDFFVDFSVGYDLQSRQTDFGIGAGGLGNMQSPTPTATGPTSPAPTGPTGASRLSGLSF